MTGKPESPKRIFTKVNLSWQQIHFVKKNVRRDNFISWLKHEFDFISCYHGCRPKDPRTYYTNGIIPSDFYKSVEDFRKILLSNSYLKPYNIKHVIEMFNGDSNRFTYFVLDKKELTHGSPHYLIYGSEFIFALSQNVDSSLKYYLKNIGIPTIFYCDIPINKVEPKYLEEIYDRILGSNGNLKSRQNYIFYNYSIKILGNLSPDSIVGHEHPTEVLQDYHTGGYYQNTLKYCEMCNPHNAEFSE